MTDIIVDGKTRVFAIADTGQSMTALTAVAINAGTKLHDLLVPTGLEGFEGASSEIDNTALGSPFETKLTGRTSFSGTNLVLKKQTMADNDPVHALLAVPGTKLIIVILDEVDASVAVAANDEYEAYRVTTGEWNHLGRGEANTILRYRVPVPVSGGRVRSAAA